MISLLVSDAVSLVRKNLDELEPNGSVMYEDENQDNLSLTDIIKRNLPEAINSVHLAAPVQLLEGKEVEDEDLTTVSVQANGVLSFSLTSGTRFLRLVAFQAVDSPIVVTDVLGEATPEGRKQLNPYIRGRADRPRLVQSQGRHTGPAFKYYSLSTSDAGFAAIQADPSSAIQQFSILEEQIFDPEQFFDEDSAAYPISRRLRQNIIDWLTAMVLETYSDQRSQAFYQKANLFSL